MPENDSNGPDGTGSSSPSSGEMSSATAGPHTKNDGALAENSPTVRTALPDSGTFINVTRVGSLDVVRLILQFLKENNLRRSVQCLQEESGVALSAVDSIQGFENDILKGRWDVVLQTVGTVRLPDEVLHSLYEHVVCELLELQEPEVAQMLLRETTALQSLRIIHPARYRRLDQLVNSGRTYFDPRDLYEGSSKEKRRLAVSKAILPCIHEAPSSRLLTLLGMALKWERHCGSFPTDSENLDLFRGVSTDDAVAPETNVQMVTKTIKFGKKNPPQCALFTPEGHHLITGSTDGIIEIWDFHSCQLNVIDFPYQQKEIFMVHEAPVLALAVSSDSRFLLSGDKDGNIKMWKLSTGLPFKIFPKAHEGGVASLCFNLECNHILSGSFDSTARIHGVKSGKEMRIFKGHESFVNSAIYSADYTRVITASSDCFVRIWNVRTSECLQKFSPTPPIHMNPTVPLPLNSVFLVSHTASKEMKDSFFACVKCNTLYLVNQVGQVLQKFSNGRRSGGDFVAACASPRGEWIYCVGEDNILYTFSSKTGTLETVQKVHDQDVVGVIHHPKKSLLVTISFDGNLHVLQP